MTGAYYKETLNIQAIQHCYETLPGTEREDIYEALTVNPLRKKGENYTDFMIGSICKYYISILINLHTCSEDNSNNSN